MRSKCNALESSPNHPPPHPRPWKHSLRQNQSLVPKRSGTAALEDPACPLDGTLGTVSLAGTWLSQGHPGLNHHTSLQTWQTPKASTAPKAAHAPTWPLKQKPIRDRCPALGWSLLSEQHLYEADKEEGRVPGLLVSLPHSSLV